MQSTILAMAIEAEDYLKTLAVLESGVDFNAVTDGITALERAALTEVSRTDIMNLLLD